MARNPIAESFHGLMLLSQRALNGATALGASLPLLINTAALLGAERAALRAAENGFRVPRGELGPRHVTLRVAMEDSRSFCTRARDVLKPWCGNRFNQRWLAAGFTHRTSIPETEREVAALVEDLASYFTAHADREVPALGVTAAAATTLRNRLQSARAAIDATLATCGSCRQDRDAKLKALRKRLSGLCQELSQRLGPLDPRWRQFGFNLPGAATVPAVPEQLVVTPLSGARLQMACDPSPNATSYRFYLQRPIVDPEPIFAGHASEPLFVTESLTAGQQYLVYVSATNEGAESGLSAPVTATTQVEMAA